MQVVSEVELTPTIAVIAAKMVPSCRGSFCKSEQSQKGRGKLRTSLLICFLRLLVVNALARSIRTGAESDNACEAPVAEFTTKSTMAPSRRFRSEASRLSRYVSTPRLTDLETRWSDLLKRNSISSRRLRLREEPLFFFRRFLSSSSSTETIITGCA